MKEYLESFLVGFKFVALFGLIIGIVILFTRAVDNNNIYVLVPTGIIIFTSLCIVLGSGIKNMPTATCHRDEEDE